MKYISVIIPFFNEEFEIKRVFKDISKFELKNNNIIKEYIFIDDGSKDKSLTLLKNFKKKFFVKNKIKIILNEKNIGWAKSLIKGYKMSSGKFSLFIPGDGEAKLCDFLKINNFEDDVVIFQRISMSSRPFIRIIMSKMYKIILSSNDEFIVNDEHILSLVYKGNNVYSICESNNKFIHSYNELNNSKKSSKVNAGLSFCNPV
jgi:glycosyltransferase involved in cell wall biosynthesis